MPSIDKLRHNIRHAVSLSAFSPNLIHRIRYFFLYTVTFRDYSQFPFYKTTSKMHLPIKMHFAAIYSTLYLSVSEQFPMDHLIIIQAIFPFYKKIRKILKKIFKTTYLLPFPVCD